MKKLLGRISLMLTGAFFIAAPAVSAPVVEVSSDYLTRTDVKIFIDDLVKEHQFSRQELEKILGQAKKSDRALELISRPAEGRLEWKDYRKIFITPERISKGVEFWQKNAKTLGSIEKEYNVPANVIVAIIGVETYYGRQTGGFRVLDTLTTLGFDYPRRSDFFRKELENFLVLVREQNLDASDLTGSYAGAMGIPQFMPSSYRAYAVDYTGNLQANIWKADEDAIASVANYLREHGWKYGKPVASRAKVTGIKYDQVLSKGLKPDRKLSKVQASGWNPFGVVPPSSKVLAMKLQGKEGSEYWLGMDNFYVITRYNRSRMYALAVHQLAQAVSKDYKKAERKAKKSLQVSK